jgi:hypothetical protein
MPYSKQLQKNLLVRAYVRVGLIDEKTEDRKSRDTVPLKKPEFWRHIQQVSCKHFIYFFLSFSWQQKLALCILYCIKIYKNHTHKTPKLFSLPWIEFVLCSVKTQDLGNFKKKKCFV